MRRRENNCEALAGHQHNHHFLAQVVLSLVLLPQPITSSEPQTRPHVGQSYLPSPLGGPLGSIFQVPFITVLSPTHPKRNLEEFLHFHGNEFISQGPTLVL